MDLAFPEARSVVVRDGKIVEAAPVDYSGAAGEGIRVIDLHGRTMLPGFIDAHCHISAFAGSLVSLDCRRGA